MKSKAVLIVIFVFSMMLIQAQNQEEKKIKYSNITEWGLLGNPSERFISFEGTTVNGFAIDGHNLGIGLGIGFGHDYGIYCPTFINYRYYFNPLKSFTPHINVALGAMSQSDGIGFYSTLTSGFRSYKFSLSSGLFFQAYENGAIPWGIMIKAGLSF